MKGEPNKEYDTVVHNFDAMNRAIDTQVDKQFELSELYRFEQTSRQTQMLMHIVISLCVIALTAGLLWWLYKHPSTLPDYITTTKIKQIEGRNQGALDSISGNQIISADEQPFINTSFTVFHRTMTPSGAYVVTGLNYEPNDLAMPVEQYCYLELNQQSEMSGTPLASINQGKMHIETTDKALEQYIALYCQLIN